MDRRSRWLRLAAASCVAAMLGGCYTYASTGLGEVKVGGLVRARVSEAAADRAEPVLGYRSTTLDGKVVAPPTSGHLLLRVPAQIFANGVVTRRYSQRVDLGASDILELETRHLDGRRTGGLVAAGVAVLAILVTRIIGTNGGSGVPSGSPGPSPAIVFIR